MKLNPPETAPKDALILALFGQEKRLYPAAWKKRYGLWEFAIHSHIPAADGSHIETDEEWEKELTGWLPMPTIDDEGNLI